MSTDVTSDYPFNISTCVAFDAEVYPERWCVGFHRPEWDRVVDGDREDLAAVLREFRDQGVTLVGFNSDHYDRPIIQSILGGLDPYRVSCGIFDNGGNALKLGLPKLPELPCDHLDICSRVRRGWGFPSLKTLAANLGRPVLRELPYDPRAVLTDDQWCEVIEYNKVDLSHIWALLEWFAPELQALAALSEEVGRDLRSTPTARVCEGIFVDAYRKKHGKKPVPRPAPTWVRYRGVKGVRRPLSAGAAAWFDKVVGVPIRVIERAGDIKTNEMVPKDRFEVAGLTLQAGAGGLHSIDAGHVYYATDEEQLVSVDVVSYYPTLIATKGISPQAYGETGSYTYDSILQRRLAIKQQAKETEDPAERARLKVQVTALKLVLNATFGKFGDRYSSFFDIEAFLSVTLSGQLMLIDLIERLSAAGVQVLSANTDGLFLRARRDLLWREVVTQWERDTEMKLEVEPLQRLAILKTNRYATLDVEGNVKRKGDDLKGMLDPTSSPNALVKNDAISGALLQDIPPERTVLGCTEAVRFCSVSRRSGKVQSAVLVAGDGTETELGKVSRWYHAKASTQRIEHRFESGRITTFPDARGIAILANLPEGGPPADTDHEWYVREAREKIQEVLGFRHRDPQLLLGHPLALAVFDHGLLPVPKVGEMDPAGGDACAPTLLWDWGEYASVGTYTGPGVGVLVVDVDDYLTFQAKVDKGNEPLLHDRWRDLADSLVSFCGDVTAEQVRTGQAKGKLIFRFEGDASHPLAKLKVDRWRKQWGIDLLYGKGLPTVLGAHPDGSAYHLEGTLGGAPGWLVEALTPKSRVRRIPVGPSPNGLDAGSTDSLSPNDLPLGGEAGGSTVTSPLELVIDLLRRRGYDPQPSGNGFKSRCPGHDGEGHSLSINTNDDGVVLLHDFARDCEITAILEPLGLEVKDLFPDGDDSGSPSDDDSGAPNDDDSDTSCNGDGQYRSSGDRIFATPEETIAGVAKVLGKPTGRWVYLDAAGAETMVIFRFDHGGKKEFRPCHRRPGGWRLGDPAGKLPLYHLPELAGAPKVYVFEGEKCTDLGRGLGVVATTTAHGADSPHKSDVTPLASKTVVIVPDAGETGERYATRLVSLLAGLEPKPTVKVLRLPDLFDDGDDIEQWLDGLPNLWDSGRCGKELERLADKEPVIDLGKGFVGPFPEVLPIRVALRPVPTLTPEMIPAPFRAWLVDIAERASCPLDSPVVSAIVSIGALVGRRIGILPKRHDDWFVVPNLWGMLVLPPGWLKTHALDEPKKPLARLELEARHKYNQACAEFEIQKLIAENKAAAAASALKEAAKAQKKKAAKGEPTEEIDLEALAAEALAKPNKTKPTLRRYVINDATIEKVGELLVDNPIGLLEFRDELMGFLYSLEKSGHESARAFYLEGWNGTGSFVYDRIGRGTIYIPNAIVSILGGIQPGRLAAYIRSTASGENDDGLISRFQLAVYPDTNEPFRNVDREPDAMARSRAYQVFKKLDEIDPALFEIQTVAGEIPCLRFSAEAQDFFDAWRVDLENKVRSVQESASLTSHLSKFRSLMPSLALLFHLVDVVDGVPPAPVSLAAAQTAATWCDYLEAHARRIYQFAFDGDCEPVQRLADRLKNSLPNPFAVRDVVKKGWSQLNTTEEVERAVDLLEEHGWVRQLEVKPGTEGGRTKIEIWINPSIRPASPYGE
jgi:putative DNA primase/helicase